MDECATTDSHPLHSRGMPKQWPSCQMTHIHTCQKTARRCRAYIDQCRRNRDAESWYPRRSLHARDIKQLTILNTNDRSPSPKVPLSWRRGLSTTNFLNIMLAVGFCEMERIDEEKDNWNRGIKCFRCGCPFVLRPRQALSKYRRNACTTSTI